MKSKLFVAIAVVALLTVLVISFFSKLSNKTTETNEDETNTQDYPANAITIIVPWSEGGDADAISRKVAEVAEGFIDQDVVVENHPGGAGTIGMSHAYYFPPDGYSLVWASGSAYVVTPKYVDVDYDVSDFSPLKGIRYNSFDIIVNTASGISSFDDLLEYAKSNVVIIASGAEGNETYTLANAMLKKLGLIGDITPYDGGGDVVNAIADNKETIGFAFEPAYYDEVSAGNIKTIATLNPNGVETPFGYVPSVREFGLDLEWMNGDFFACRSDVPEDRKEFLADLLDKVYESDDFKKYMIDHGYEIWNATPEEINIYLNNLEVDMDEYVDLIAE